jgi:hypothetical protein
MSFYIHWLTSRGIKFGAQVPPHTYTAISLCFWIFITLLFHLQDTGFMHANAAVGILRLLTFFTKELITRNVLIFSVASFLKWRHRIMTAWLCKKNGDTRRTAGFQNNIFSPCAGRYQQWKKMEKIRSKRP